MSVRKKTIRELNQFSCKYITYERLDDSYTDKQKTEIVTTQRKFENTCKKLGLLDMTLSEAIEYLEQFA